MRLDELDTTMRLYETAHDYRVLPGLQLVARLDGRGFTRLTSEVHRFARPFDPQFRDLMAVTTEHKDTSWGRRIRRPARRSPRADGGSCRTWTCRGGRLRGIHRGATRRRGRGAGDG
jgi:hypothetical protein